MFSLFSTSSDKAGFRLQYMEVYNWGTFDRQIFKIAPKGNNSLLTGANASGKSTFIDALLTLLVPVKNDRFYNQSSGVEKKGDRTEETYVCGHYGDIQKEGELGTTTQKLRDKSTYSVLLASFANTDGEVVTLFQVRWFTNAELKRQFGIARIPLEIEKDFVPFDGKGNWKKRLDKSYNTISNTKRVDFLDGPTKYGERMASLLGMRSVKASSLFNQVVGVKVLEDLDEFIRTNMLEYQDAEAEFIQLKESFLTLMDAKTNIEKAKEQINQLEPINEIAVQLTTIEDQLNKLQRNKEVAVYWFAKTGVELTTKELERCKNELLQLETDLESLRAKEEEFKEQERFLSIAIERDSVGSQIKTLEKELKQAERSRDNAKNKSDNYNLLARELELPQNPNAQRFRESKALALLKDKECEVQREAADEILRAAKNERDRLATTIDELVQTIQALQKNKNNIAGREAVIREDILMHLGADKEEIPFVGELIRVREEEMLWENAIEKLLHGFALRLIVPEKYYAQVNAYVNGTNLKGKITFQRYRNHTSLKSMRIGSVQDELLINKLEFKKGSPYVEWLEDTLAEHYHYTCVGSLAEFNRFEERAMTKEGLIKFVKGKHEKDDRPHVNRRENFVLGWDNKEKITLLKSELSILQGQQTANQNSIGRASAAIKKIDELKKNYYKLCVDYKEFEEIDWEVHALDIQQKRTAIQNLEKANDKIIELQSQLESAKQSLVTIEEKKDKNGKLRYQMDGNITNVEAELRELQTTIFLLRDNQPDTSDFEMENQELLKVVYSEFKEEQRQFHLKNSRLKDELIKDKTAKEAVVRININTFKQPSEAIVLQFKDWRSDVSSLPDSTHLEFLGEYQNFLKRLKEDNLPKYERKFNEYLQETITNKIGDFRMFFENWVDSIKENIRLLNEALIGIDFKNAPKTYIQLVAPVKINDEVKTFRTLLHSAIPNVREVESSIDGKKNHFDNHIEPLIRKLEKEDWRNKVMDVRSWFSYKAEEFYKETNQKFKTYENMGQLSGGEKAQLTYTILGSAIAYQFGLTKEGLQTNSFRFIAIDEAFKAQDEDKARYLITLCKQLHLQLLVVTPSDNIHIVENDISFVHFVERKDEKHSWLYDMPIEQFKMERAQFLSA
jgi:uncharacterized protein YPO0396